MSHGLYGDHPMLPRSFKEIIWRLLVTKPRTRLGTMYAGESLAHIFWVFIENLQDNLRMSEIADIARLAYRYEYGTVNRRLCQLSDLEYLVKPRQGVYSVNWGYFLFEAAKEAELYRKEREMNA